MKGQALKTVQRLLVVSLLAASFPNIAWDAAAADSADEQQFEDWLHIRGSDGFQYIYMQDRTVRSYLVDVPFEARDVDRARQALAARQRAEMAFGMLLGDLDNDGKVTAKELARLVAVHPRLDAQRRWRDYTIADGNCDGIVTSHEALAFAGRGTPQPGSEKDDLARLDLLLSIDPTADGRITADDINQLKRAAFAPYYLKKEDIPACLRSTAIVPACSTLTWVEE